MEVKIVFGEDFSEENIRLILGRDDSGFVVDTRRDLYSLTDPAFLAAVTVAGTIFSAGQLACALWEIYQNARQGSAGPVDPTVKVELPDGTIVSVPAENQELAEKFLGELSAGEPYSGDLPSA